MLKKIAILPICAICYTQAERGSIPAIVKLFRIPQKPSMHLNIFLKPISCSTNAKRIQMGWVGARLLTNIP